MNFAPPGEAVANVAPAAIDASAPTTGIGRLPKFNKSVSMCAWGLNEELLVDEFLNRATALLDATVNEWEIVFVNDGSTDRTGAIVDAWAAREPRIRVIHHERNLNIGACFVDAVKSASKDYVFCTTVDWSYDLKHLRIFLELLNHYDVVQGIRPVPIRLFSYIPVLRSIYRVKSRSDNLKKAIVSLGNYYLLRILFGVHFHDFQNVTIYPRKLVHSIEMQGRSSFLNPECLFRVYDLGARFIEVPIHFIPRTRGKAKGTKLSSIWRSIRDISDNWLRWGWRIRLRAARQPSEGRIDRVAEPFKLHPDVAALVVPLFQEFR
jgi:glycosyltransferase involved in cell wall biosynthesis